METEEYQSFVRRLLAAYGRRIEEGDAEMFAEMARLHAEFGEIVASTARALVDKGTSWNQLAEAVGEPVVTLRDRWQGRERVSRGPVVYGLREVDTEEIRYVGKSRNAGARFAGHLSGAWRSNAPVSTWVRKVGPARVEMVILERLAADATDADLSAAERRWIEQTSSDGARLTNLEWNPSAPDATADDRDEQRAEASLSLRRRQDEMSRRIMAETERNARERLLARPVLERDAWWAREVDKLIANQDITGIEPEIIARLDKYELWPLVQKARGELRSRRHRRLAGGA